MDHRSRLKYTGEMRSYIWDRYQLGDPMKSIGRSFDRPSSSIHNLLSRNHSRISLVGDLLRPLPSGGAQEFIPAGFSVASLLMELCKRRILRNERRQSLRWCPGRRCEQRESWNVVFLLAKMSQKPNYDVLVFDVSDDSGRTAAAATIPF